MKTITTIFSLLIILLFSSCQKELDIDLPTGGNGTTNDSTVLWKYLQVDTKLPPGLDTLGFSLFEYDNQDRISKINLYDRSDTSSSSAYTGHAETKYYYSGNDTLPFKTTFFTNDFGFAMTDTIYYNYQQGFVSYDSSISFLDDPFGPTRYMTVRNFSNGGSNVASNQKTYTWIYPSPPFLCESNLIYVIGYLNGNIVSENGSSTGCGVGGWDIQASYDNKVNPFYSLSIPYRTLLDSRGFFQLQQKNNTTETVSSSMNQHTKSSYTYRNDGYPLVVRVQDLFDIDHGYKGIYFYTR